MLKQIFQSDSFPKGSGPWSEGLASSCSKSCNPISSHSRSLWQECFHHSRLHLFPLMSCRRASYCMKHLYTLIVYRKQRRTSGLPTPPLPHWGYVMCIKKGTWTEGQIMDRIVKKIYIFFFVFIQSHYQSSIHLGVLFLF